MRTEYFMGEINITIPKGSTDQATLDRVFELLGLDPPTVDDSTIPAMIGVSKVDWPAWKLRLLAKLNHVPFTVHRGGRYTPRTDLLTALISSDVLDEFGAVSPRAVDPNKIKYSGERVDARDPIKIHLINLLSRYEQSPPPLSISTKRSDVIERLTKIGAISAGVIHDPPEPRKRRSPAPEPEHRSYSRLSASWL